MSNYATDASSASLGPILSAPKRRSIFAALALAAILETSVRICGRLDVGNDVVLNLLSVVAVTLACTSIVVLAGYTCRSRVITVTMVIAALSIFTSSVLHITGEFPILDPLPVLGGSSPYHSLVISIADILGISAWILGFSGLVFELHEARTSLAEKHNLLIREADERLRTKRSLEKSEALFRAVFERADTGIALLDDSGNILRSNDLLCKTLGIPAATLEATNLATLISEGQREVLNEGLGALKSGLSTSHRNEYQLLHGDGRLVWFSIGVTTFGARTGVDGTLVAILEDQTERKLQENRILHQQKMESIGLLAGGVAHDFNNLFVGIMANAELLNRDLTGHPESTAICSDIVTSTQRAASLCQQLLAYAGKVPFTSQNLNVTELVHTSENFLRMAVARNATLSIDCADDLPSIQADPTHLRQALLNLLSNASDALAGQAGELRVSTGQLRIGDTLPEGLIAQDGPPPSGDYVTLSVSDSGGGISLSQMEKLFDPFYTTKKMGTGLGLAAVQGIVRTHGGFMKVTSQANRCTEFQLLFPSSGKPATPLAEAPPRPVSEVFPSANGTVLLVDDEEMVIGAARRILERSGLAVLTARNGQEGVDIFRENHQNISVVLLDLTMPVMNGETACVEMRAINPNVPIVLSSGYSETEANDPNAVAHVSGYIRKPYRIKTLLDTINSVIAGDSPS